MVERVFDMNLITFNLVVNILSFVKLTEAQCYKNGTCVCHCADCSSGCQSCSPGWSGSTENFCQKANTLYQFYSMNSENINVLDGNSNTYEESKDSSPFIRVHLKESKVISRLDITIQLVAGNEYSVYVKDNKYATEDDLKCNTFTYNGVGTIQTIPFVCKQPLEGKYIQIVTSLTSTLRVYEIEQFECTNGSFGYNCSDICPNSCSGQCNKVTGRCACNTGFWGTHCNKTCPMRCKAKLCDSASGDCVDCVPGNYGLGCNGQCSPGCQDICNTTSGSCQCKQGFHSADCSQQCIENCNNRFCLQESGFCASCIPGKYGNFCNANCLGDCDGNCVQTTGLCGNCAKGKYGFYCNETCHKNCEGNICDRATGKCSDCVKKAYGLYCNETCPRNCDGDICDRVTGRCKQCKIGYMGDTCLENCPDHCKECSQDGYKCNRCEDGWYGVKCETRCQESCGGNTTCDIDSGWCHVCSVGYFGNFCEQKCSDNCDASYMCDKITGNCRSCKAGKRGPFCAESCSEHCRNLSCSMNESCINGCEDGWFGPQCKYKCNYALRSCAKCKFIDDDDEPVCIQCSDAWFLNGSKCSECPRNCSLCLSDSKCHECKNNHFYGKTCNLPCNAACRNKTCDITGQCTLECENSKYGTKCDQDCPVGCRSCRNALLCLSCEDGFNKNCERCDNNVTCRKAL
uniref:Multiple epidermal growth factor-like domains protein 6 isoform X2 n=1 Tax=Crassostrea virginica TaxID=6565 RepID=A0A8B8CC64_CRAVI|nr:multiple epidermal growth factor-like domains protein 6 isoform X2 [Crassostrea virginica]